MPHLRSHQAGEEWLCKREVARGGAAAWGGQHGQGPALRGQSVGSCPQMDGHPSGVRGTGRVAVTMTSHGSCPQEEMIKHNHLFQTMVSATEGEKMALESAWGWGPLQLQCQGKRPLQETGGEG